MSAVIDRSSARSRGWSPRRTHTGGCDRVPEPIWRPCPGCWGQRVILEPVRRPGGALVGYRSLRCSACLGVGEVPA